MYSQTRFGGGYDRLCTDTGAESMCPQRQTTVLDSLKALQSSEHLAVLTVTLELSLMPTMLS